MNATFASVAALAALFSGVLSAADPQLLNLVMPDVKVMADINVTPLVDFEQAAHRA